jgi:hypothetical protein
VRWLLRNNLGSENVTSRTAENLHSVGSRGSGPSFSIPKPNFVKLPSIARVAAGDFGFLTLNTYV